MTIFKLFQDLSKHQTTGIKTFWIQQTGLNFWQSILPPLTIDQSSEEDISQSTQSHV